MGGSLQYMKIYNTLTRKKEEFIPIEKNKVRMYVCGPTVYNFIHIGNARPMIIFDTVRRYFEYKGYQVNYVSNFTDVDDKIIRKAMEQQVDASEISEHYIEEVKRDMQSLNVKPATVHPKATEEISGMVSMIQTLIEKGNAYEKNGTVYFRTRSFPDYGKLSKKNIDDLEAGHRNIQIAGEEEKEDSLDFVLWKPKKEGEPFWESPWGQGRPGWHIECSVMSKKYLGDQIDIHAGGEDLIFPHHENEIAQSEAANGVPFSRYWMHNGFLNIDNKKMSKSEGNFFTVREIGEKYPYEVLRFFMLSAHYRSPLNFSDELMEAAKNGLERIQTSVFNLEHLMKASDIENDEPLPQAAKEFLNELDRHQTRFNEAMENDFNTADAVSAIFDIVRFANISLTANSPYLLIKEVYDRILLLCSVLGIEARQEQGLLDKEIETLIAERQEARKEKNFARADKIRTILADAGILLEDTREGVRWKRI